MGGGDDDLELLKAKGFTCLVLGFDGELSVAGSGEREFVDGLGLDVGDREDFLWVVGVEGVDVVVGDGGAIVWGRFEG